VRGMKMDIRSLEYALDKSLLLIITDHNGTITYANEFVCATSQYNQHELVGRQYREFFGDFHGDVDQNWKGEIRSKKKDGTFYWVDISIIPFRNEQGVPYQYIAIGSDITKQKTLEEEVVKSNEKYRLIAENTADIVSIIATDGSFRYVSPSIATLLGFDNSTIEEGTIYDVIHADDKELIDKNVTAYLAKKKGSLQIEFRLQNHEGESIDVEATVNAVSDPTVCSAADDDELLVVVMRDIRVRKLIEQKIYHLAYHDPLTNMPNRRLFMNRLNEEINLRRDRESKLALLYVDLDNFKAINDQWGHDLGDLVLTETARLIRKAIRPSDTAARLGGDEFIVMLKDVQEEYELQTSIERILQQFQKPMSISGQQYELTCSIGVALYPEHGRRAEELITNADEALYSVKGSGKNNYVVFNKKIENQLLERRLLETALRTGIKEEQFYLEYQPKFNISTNELFGMESLVRWNHPDLGKISPLNFIPLAERTGLIVPLGEWILRKSCEQAVHWQQKGYPSLTISVNVSARQLEDSNFVVKVKEIIEETKLDPKCLELEVTESVFVDMENSALVLQDIRKLGVQISHEKAEAFVEEICQRYGRYRRDQLLRLKQVALEHPHWINRALERCLHENWYSANDVRDVVFFLKQTPPEPVMESSMTRSKTSISIPVHTRDVKAYLPLMGGIGYE